MVWSTGVDYYGAKIDSTPVDRLREEFVTLRNFASLSLLKLRI
jgi:hypothetical protein